LSLLFLIYSKRNVVLIPPSKRKATCSQFKHQIHDQHKKIYIILKLCPERKKTKTFCHFEINLTDIFYPNSADNFIPITSYFFIEKKLTVLICTSGEVLVLKKTEDEVVEKAFEI
jgi:hypothetical protein